jgi:hypothetical protein
MGTELTTLLALSLAEIESTLTLKENRLGKFSTAIHFIVFS